jgi:hypothetical protein
VVNGWFSPKDGKKKGFDPSPKMGMAKKAWFITSNWMGNDW